MVAHWLAAAVAGRPLRVCGDPRICRDYIYVGDLTEAMLAVCRLVGPDEWGDPCATVPVVNIGSGVRTPLIEALTVVVEAVGPPVAVEFEAARGFDRGDVWLDVSAATRLLAWRPQISLRHGIGATWQAMRRPTSVAESPLTSAVGNGVYPSVVAFGAD